MSYNPGLLYYKFYMICLLYLGGIYIEVVKCFDVCNVQKKVNAPFKLDQNKNVDIFVSSVQDIVHFVAW